jgi:hypothetical protein
MIPATQTDRCRIVEPRLMTQKMRDRIRTLVDEQVVLRSSSKDMETREGEWRSASG